jgi:hypothetical protein
VSDDDDDAAARRSLNKLKTAADTLKSAQRASRNTVRDVKRAQRAVAKAKQGMRQLGTAKARGPNKRRERS